MVETKEMTIMSGYVTEDHMSAYITIEKDFEDVKSAKIEYSELLVELGVTNGVNDEFVSQIFNDKKRVVNVKVAQGQLPVNGKDAVLTYHFDLNHHTSPKANEDGSVNYKDMNFVPASSKGDLLVEKEASTEGVDGMDVEGNIIPAVNGRDAFVRAGKNCIISENGLKIYANKDGVILFENNTLSISTTLDIPEDIGVETGNISFNGDVTVHGDVLSGMSVKCKKLHVGGLIEDAEIVASGDVDVTGGIQGNEHSVINCAGNIHCKYISNTTVYSKGNIDAEMIINCHVRCDSEIHVKGKKGCIIGGKIITKGNIDAKSIGSELGVKTTFVLGEVSTLIEEIKVVEAEVVELESVGVKTEQCLLVLNDKLEKMPTHEKYHELKLQYTRNKFVTQHELNKKHDQLLRLHNSLTESGVIMLHSEKIYPGTHISIGRNNISVEDIKKECTVKSVRGELLIEEKTA